MVVAEKQFNIHRRLTPSVIQEEMVHELVEKDHQEAVVETV